MSTDTTQTTPDTLTLVFEIKDAKAFDQAYPELTTFKSDKNKSFGIVAVSRANEVKRSTLIGEIVDRVDDLYDLKEMISKATNLFEPAEFDTFEKQFNKDWPDPLANALPFNNDEAVSNADAT